MDLISQLHAPTLPVEYKEATVRMCCDIRSYYTGEYSQFL